jgi:hypothetical protein
MQSELEKTFLPGNDAKTNLNISINSLLTLRGIEFDYLLMSTTPVRVFLMNLHHISASFQMCE